jgi:hypothetical protein
LRSTALGHLATIDEQERPQVNPARFSWELESKDGPAVAGGVDFGVVFDGPLQTITGFLDFAPGASGE